MELSRALLKSQINTKEEYHEAFCWRDRSNFSKKEKPLSEIFQSNDYWNIEPSKNQIKNKEKNIDSQLLTRTDEQNPRAKTMKFREECHY